ncbi:hypothetical protein BCR39DRAFT_539994, partial [Naematelia encephala]
MRDPASISDHTGSLSDYLPFPKTGRKAPWVEHVNRLNVVRPFSPSSGVSIIERDLIGCGDGYEETHHLVLAR